MIEGRNDVYELTPLSYFVETCRCHKRITTNYRIFTPYVGLSDESLPTNASKMDGMLPYLLNDLALTCCKTCKLHGKSYVDFNLNGKNQPAMQKSPREVKSQIDDYVDLSFPIYGWTWLKVYEGYYRYIPLVQSPGIAYIVIMDDSIGPAEKMFKSILELWSYLALTLLLAAVAGIIGWFLVSWSFLFDCASQV